ncbi:MAG: hypothetical protein GY832_23630 [Chloroflexi bacterium]|nr:hypothetical protein [Chloroflexota bacterium]
MLDDITEPGDDLSLITGLPLEVATVGVERMLALGVVTICDGALLIPNFIEAQEASKSDKQRQRESRERRRTKATAVTKRDEKSRAVTSGHERSQPVTPTRAVPCRTDPVPKKREYTKEFETWWKGYPRKENKRGALKAFQKARNEVDLATLTAAVATARESEQWKKGVIPHAATWLNAGRWEDEINEPTNDLEPGEVLIGGIVYDRSWLTEEERLKHGIK